MATASRAQFAKFFLENFTSDKRAFGSILGTIVIAAVTIAVVVFGSYWVGGLTKAFVRHEKIEIKDIYVVKNGENYVVTISYANTGSEPTGIDLVTLNGVPTSDYEPAAVLGLDFDPLPSACETGVSKIGTITIQPGATDPSGNKMNVGSALTVTLYTTGGENYPTMVTLP